MEDTRKPSRQMVEKLLQAQGVNIRLGEALRGDIMKVVVPLMSCGTPEEKMKRVMDKVNEDEIMGELTGAYSRYFSAGDVMDMTAFFKSPAGKKYAAAAVSLSTDINAVMSRINTRVIMEIIKDNVEHMAASMDPDDQGDPPAADDFSEFEDPDKFDEIK